MENPSFLRNQKLPSGNKISFKKVFFLVFFSSLALNMYFLVFADGKHALSIDNFENPLKEAEVFASPVTIQPDGAIRKKDKEIPAGKDPLNREARVIQAAFSPQAYSTGKLVHSLNFKLRNSLNYTLCRLMPRKAGCESLAAHMARLMGWFFDIHTKMRNGDKVSVVYKNVTGEGRFRILRVRYQSGFFNKTFEANFFRGPGMKFGSYFNAEGVEITKRISDSQTPIKGYREITSLPGDFRRGGNEHSGTDFKTKIGTPIYSSFEGRITRTNWNLKMNGYCVEIDHPRQGVKSLYLHLSRVLVKTGQFVRQGQKIAESGNTGRTFAPHLHFEIKHRKNKRIFYNPFKLKFLKTYQRTILHSQKEAFRKTLERYDSILQAS